jgi:hypothetical protein
MRSRLSLCFRISMCVVLHVECALTSLFCERIRVHVHGVLRHLNKECNGIKYTTL